MKRKDKEIWGARERICAICKKPIYVPDAEAWVFKTGYSESRKTYYCSWHCMREAERQKDGKKRLHSKTMPGMRETV